MVLRLAGLGLGSPDYLTIRALESIRRSKRVYLDLYTGYVSDELLSYIISNAREVVRADRGLLEDDVKQVIDDARIGDVTVAIPGDPLFATTHIAMLVMAERMAIEYEVIHGVSIVSAASASSGLSPYRFGRIATLARSPARESAGHVCETIASNSSYGLHTLVLLDTAMGGMTAGEAARILINLGREQLDPQRLVIVLARLGLSGEVRWVGTIGEIEDLKLPPPPHCLIFPAGLHSTEREALSVLLKGRQDAISRHNPPPSLKERTIKYVQNTSRVMRDLWTVNEVGVSQVIALARSYLEDAENFINSGRVVDGLVSVVYAEGLLDALRALDKVKLEW
ncbi:MAG: diphthine synthase [Aigarchaeota archaeon]|nr:diphthine synthase [Aigarchaeota archaeon]MDW8092933.1 diphthine synthase [Nitrososphaerota archaeon]